MKYTHAVVPAKGTYSATDRVAAIALTNSKRVALQCSRVTKRTHRVVACDLDSMSDARWIGEDLDRVPSVE